MQEKIILLQKKIKDLLIVYRKRTSRFLDNIKNYKDPFVQWLRQKSFTVKIRVQIPYGLYKVTLLYIYL
jgi:hypothetical protein